MHKLGEGQGCGKVEPQIGGDQEQREVAEAPLRLWLWTTSRRAGRDTRGGDEAVQGLLKRGVME